MGVPLNLSLNNSKLLIPNRNKRRVFATKKHTAQPLTVIRNNRSNLRNNRRTATSLTSLPAVNIAKVNYNFPSPNIATNATRAGPLHATPVMQQLVKENIASVTPKRGSVVTIKPSVKRTLGKRHLVGGKKRRHSKSKGRHTRKYRKTIKH
jgi:hypothetical protein